MLVLSDTSRPSRPGEIHGKDYFFDTREQMQIDVEAGKFIEHGEYRGNLYGTSTDGVRDLIASGLQPIVSPHYQVSPPFPNRWGRFCPPFEIFATLPLLLQSNLSKNLRVRMVKKMQAKSEGALRTGSFIVLT